MSGQPREHFLSRVVATFLRGDVAILLTVVSLLLGAAALWLTPREEEPQIDVPLADVFIHAPGLSAEEVERQVATQLEKRLFQIDGVEHVYSVSQPGRAVVTVRFFVGEGRVESLVKLHNKIRSNIDDVPPSVTGWVVKPVDIDDIPIVNITLWSERPATLGPHELRRVAEQFQNEFKAIRDTNRVTVIGGRPRRVSVYLDLQRLAAHTTTVQQVAGALEASNVQRRAGSFARENQEYVVDAGVFLPDAAAVGDLVVNVVGGRPVYLRDVAEVVDGPAEVDNYSWIGFGPADETQVDTTGVFPAVHVAIAKRKGTNAVWVAEAIEQRMAALAETQLPAGVRYRVTRDYGETANDKVNELIEGLAVAVVTVIALIGLTLGWRAALVVALAIPVCYSLTLFFNLMVGYTINRVTMFALILALGLLVDDPITDVENIARLFKDKRGKPRDLTIAAVNEVRPALIVSTLAIIAAFAPLAFITGMMGPYMRPMALNVPVAVIVSTVVVAFLITPWLSMVALKHTVRAAEAGAADEEPVEQKALYRFYRAWLGPILQRRWRCALVLVGVFLLFVGSLVLPMFRVIPLKMLPFDNKDEFQLVIDMDEGTTLEATDAVARRLGAYLGGVAEVRDFQIYVGLSSPMDFNGMVRHYYLRQGPAVAAIRVNLAPKRQRAQQSHELILRIRDDIAALATESGANVKLVEVPPGPPVMATITAEVYGPPHARYTELIAAGRTLAARFQAEPGLVDVDVSAEAPHPRWTFVTDKAKAALAGVSPQQIAQLLRVALDGQDVGVLHLPDEVDPLLIELRLPRPARAAIARLEQLHVVGGGGQRVQLGTLGRFERDTDDQPIYHKNLRRVVFVFAEAAGRAPADAIIDMQFDRVEAGRAFVADRAPRAVAGRTWLAPGGGIAWSLPPGYRVEWAGEGEWQITLDVFRDLGLAFAAALVLIFVILLFQTGSRALPLLLMLAIPLELIGVLPGFWLLNWIVSHAVGGYEVNLYFTATAMIGIIVLAGIVIRNSVLLLDFIRYGLQAGLGVQAAVLQSVTVRTRPILLTAATTLIGNIVITLDPIFAGLAWAIIFGITASSLFTLVVIPVAYVLLFGRSQRAG